MQAKNLVYIIMKTKNKKPQKTAPKMWENRKNQKNLKKIEKRY